MLKKILFSLPLMLALFCQGAGAANMFSPNVMKQVICAATKMQLFYHYFGAEQDETVKNYQQKGVCGNARFVMPPWIDAKRPEMLSRKVWRDPEEGALSEAAVWQTPISVLYEYFDVTRKTFPSEFGGAGIPPGMLVKEYSDIRIRFQLALDRLYRARTKDFIMGDSMQGRGRTIMAVFNLLLKEMESVSDAISSSDSKRFAEAISASAVLSQDAFSLLFRAPRVYQRPAAETSTQKMIHIALTVFGMFLVFLSVRLVLSDVNMLSGANSDKFNAQVVKYQEAFQRQFIKINVKHLMLAPGGILFVVGMLLFMNPIAAIVFGAIGLYVGYGLPETVLQSMKAKRGRQIDAQLMDSLILMSNCLRSGLDIVQGFEMVSKDSLPPISDEFGLVIKNYQLGMTFEKALGVMEERVTSKMLSYMIRSIVLQRQIGGNITKVFERIVSDIREESKLEEKTKAMTAQNTIQSYVIGIMPWAMTGVMFLFQADTMIKFYASPAGLAVLIFCIIWVGIGMKTTMAASKIEV